MNIDLVVEIVWQGCGMSLEFTNRLGIPAIPPAGTTIFSRLASDGNFLEVEVSGETYYDMETARFSIHCKEMDWGRPFTNEDEAWMNELGWIKTDPPPRKKI